MDFVDSYDLGAHYYRPTLNKRPAVQDRRPRSRFSAHEGTQYVKTPLPKHRTDGPVSTATKKSAQPPEKTVPYGPEREIAALRSSLQSYGRSIIKSALDHPPEAAEGF